MFPTSETLQPPARRTNRTYDAQFKAEMVAACLKPDASIQDDRLGWRLCATAVVGTGCYEQDQHD